MTDGDDEWIAVRSCPVCGDEELENLGELDPNYYWGERQLTPGDGTLRLNRCESCGVFFKSCVPAHEYLCSLLRERLEVHHDEGWSDTSTFEFHVSMLEDCLGRDFSLLDVGCWKGEFLRESLRLDGIRSGLDLFYHPDLDDLVDGEFFATRLEDLEPAQAERRYDAVTLFDVIEHLYRPRRALRKARELLRSGGYMFIETGNAESFWPRLVGLKNWRYVVKDPMHHVFWNRDAIRYLAADLDLEVVNIESTHHRTDHGKSYGKRMRHWLELTLFGLSPGLYRTLARTMDRKTRYPPLPRTEDHIFCVLRKE